LYINFNGGNGARRIVLVKKGAAVQGLPDDGVEYNTNAAFGTINTAFTRVEIIMLYIQVVITI
jgi:hypothetical protein